MTEDRADINKKNILIMISKITCLAFLGVVIFSFFAFAEYCPFGGCKNQKPIDLYADSEFAELMLSYKNNWADNIDENLSKDWEFLDRLDNSQEEIVKFGAYYSESAGVCYTEVALVVSGTKKFEEY